MKKNIQKATIVMLTVWLCCTNSLHSQVFQTAAKDAYIITRMADKIHISPKPINEQFSIDVFNSVIKKLDNEKVFFTTDDLRQLEVYKNTLHTELLNKKTNFIELLAKLYQQKLQVVDTMIASISKQKFNLTAFEKLTVTEDTNFSINTAALQQKVYKILKGETLQSIAEYLVDENEKLTNKKLIDSLEIVYRKKVCDAVNRSVQRDLQYPGGVQQLVCNTYCEAIANCFDPHTEFFTATQRENFESGIGKKNMIFGFSLNENNEGEAVIQKLVPGSPAFKSGLINKGDKIIAIQWSDSKPIDVSTASISEISQMLSTSNHAQATLTFLKADGTKQQVTLTKEISTDQEEDDDKVSSYVLKGTKNIGFISLPSFYEDWENESNVNGCSNDVAKEIIKLKKENIDGLVLDLRYNGGGSLHEAVELAGLFIDAGPVTQMKKRNSKILTFKDMNRGTVYDGPLAILVNGFSASASELLAGVLQDYNRAIIIGSNTFGKATGQVVFPMDTTIEWEKYYEKDIKGNAIKITLSQLFQVSGKTAQFTGVVPDIVLPDPTDAYDIKERNEPFAIPSSNIEANKYYIPLKPLPLAQLKSKALEYEKEDSNFIKLQKNIALKKASKATKDVTLKLEDYYKRAMEIDNNTNSDETVSSNTTKIFEVANTNFEKERLQSKTDFALISELVKVKLQNDAHIKIAYKLLLLMNN